MCKHVSEIIVITRVWTFGHEAAKPVISAPPTTAGAVDSLVCSAVLCSRPGFVPERPEHNYNTRIAIVIRRGNYFKRNISLDWVITWLFILTDTIESVVNHFDLHICKFYSPEMICPTWKYPDKKNWFCTINVNFYCILHKSPRTTSAARSWFYICAKVRVHIKFKINVARLVSKCSRYLYNILLCSFEVQIILYISCTFALEKYKHREHIDAHFFVLSSRENILNIVR